LTISGVVSHEGCFPASGSQAGFVQFAVSGERFLKVENLFFLIRAEMVSPRQERLWLATGHRQKPLQIHLSGKFSGLSFYVTE
jgi:hypothetical protein